MFIVIMIRIYILYIIVLLIITKQSNEYLDRFWISSEISSNLFFFYFVTDPNKLYLTEIIEWFVYKDKIDKKYFVIKLIIIMYILQLQNKNLSNYTPGIPWKSY